MEHFRRCDIHSERKFPKYSRNYIRSA